MVLFGAAYAMAGAWTTLDFLGATDTSVQGINGSNIVGTYNNGDGFGSHGFLYVIPEPATLLLFGLGAVMFIRKREKSL